MYLKDIRTGKILETKNENGKLIIIPLEPQEALEGLEREINETKDSMKQWMKTYKEKIRDLKKNRKAMQKEISKWEITASYESERDARQTAKEINQKGGQAEVRNSHHMSKAFKEGKIWTVYTKITKQKVEQNGKGKTD